MGRRGTGEGCSGFQNVIDAWLCIREVGGVVSDAGIAVVSVK